MAEGIENIGKKEVVWSYAATVFTVGAGVILLPFILYALPAETVGIWGIFQIITGFVLLIDFGFRPSFARNISYVFAGVSKLQTVGVAQVNSETATVDYSLLKSTIAAMRRFYRLTALVALVLLGVAGTAYMYYILQKYQGDKTEVMTAWVLFVVINCYNLYTYYYDALITGKGYIKRIQQITIIGQTLYIGVAVALLYCGFGLIAIVSAQLLSVIIRRVLAHTVFYDKAMRSHLKTAVSNRETEHQVMRAIYPNAVKVGLTQVGGFLVTKSATLIGGAFLPLDIIGSYATTVQVADVLCRCGCVVYQSYTPKLAQYRAENNLRQLKQLYVKSVLSLIAIMVAGSAVFVLWGDDILQLIRSHTMFLPTGMLSALLFISLLEQNHVVAAGFIMADNKIPFFIPSLLSGAATILLMWLSMQYLDMGVWGMILAPGIAQLAYQNWKWPSVVIKELKNA